MKVYTIRQAMEHLGEGNVTHARKRGSEHNGGKMTSERRKAEGATALERTLTYIRSKECVTIQEVAYNTQMSYSGAAKHISKLVKQGHVIKMPNNSPKSAKKVMSKYKAVGERT